MCCRKPLVIWNYLFGVKPGPPPVVPENLDKPMFSPSGEIPVGEYYNIEVGTWDDEGLTYKVQLVYADLDGNPTNIIYESFTTQDLSTQKIATSDLIGSTLILKVAASFDGVNFSDYVFATDSITIV